MSEVPATPDVEKYTAAFTAKCQAVPEPLRGLFVDYLVPILEGQRQEYVDGLEFLAQRLEEGEGIDPEFLDRVLQTVGAIGMLSNLALQRGGWVDAQGMPTSECPADLKAAFTTAQQHVNTLAAEIKEMQTDDDVDGE